MSDDMNPCIAFVLIIMAWLGTGIYYISVGCDKYYQKTCTNYWIENGIISSYQVITDINTNLYQLDTIISYGHNQTCTISGKEYGSQSAAFADASSIQIGSNEIVYVLKSNSEYCNTESTAKWKFDLGFGLLLSFGIIVFLISCCGIYSYYESTTRNNNNNNNGNKIRKFTNVNDIL
jgi:hypothetical protein